MLLEAVLKNKSKPNNRIKQNMTVTMLSGREATKGYQDTGIDRRFTIYLKGTCKLQTPVWSQVGESSPLGKGKADSLLNSTGWLRDDVSLPPFAVL